MCMCVGGGRGGGRRDTEMGDKNSVVEVSSHLEVALSRLSTVGEYMYQCPEGKFVSGCMDTFR